MQKIFVFKEEICFAIDDLFNNQNFRKYFKIRSFEVRSAQSLRLWLHAAAFPLPLHSFSFAFCTKASPEVQFLVSSEELLIRHRCRLLLLLADLRKVVL